MLLRTLIFVFCILPVVNFADEQDDFYFYQPADPVKLPDELKEVSLPDFPNDYSQTYKFPVDGINDFIFSIEANSLTVDADEVIRYTVILTSPSNAKNVFYEGIRCATSEYKTYAYGTNNSQRFQKKRDVTWQPIRLNERGVMRYRNALSIHYFCDKSTHIPLPKTSIISNLKLGKDANIFKYVD